MWKTQRGKRKLNRAIALAVCLIAVALILQMAILTWINDKNTAKMSEMLLDRVVDVIEKNEEDEQEIDLHGGDDIVPPPRSLRMAAADSPSVSTFRSQAYNLPPPAAWIPPDVSWVVLMVVSAA